MQKQKINSQDKNLRPLTPVIFTSEDAEYLPLSHCPFEWQAPMKNQSDQINVARNQGNAPIRSMMLLSMIAIVLLAFINNKKYIKFNATGVAQKGGKGPSSSAAGLFGTFKRTCNYVVEQAKLTAKEISDSVSGEEYGSLAITIISAMIHIMVIMFGIVP